MREPDGEFAGTSAGIDLSLPPDSEKVLHIRGVGGRIAMARQRKGWTQRELSERVGKSRGTIVQYEQGKIEPPLRQIELISNLLDVAPELLAFGRQGITGLAGENSQVTPLPEIKLQECEELVSGGYGLPETLISDFAIDTEGAKVVVLSHAAPAFGLAAGDRVIINPCDTMELEDQIYALRTRRGVDIVRLLANFSMRTGAIKLNDGAGETHSYDEGELEVVGRVVGSIRAA